MKWQQRHVDVWMKFVWRKEIKHTCLWGMCIGKQLHTAALFSLFPNSFGYEGDGGDVGRRDSLCSPASESFQVVQTRSRQRGVSTF